MGRYPQAEARSGSQRWMQQLVRDYRAVLNRAIGLGHIEWRSPLQEDDYAEYRDDAFLERLGIALSGRSLSDFWPSLGPQWDGLGIGPHHACVLVEAKAHLEEMFSLPSQAEDPGLSQIRRALDEAASQLGARPGLDWTKRFYQYTNRLAHAQFLRTAGVESVVLVFLHIIGDTEMGGPRSRTEWEAAITTIHEAIGLRGRMPKFVRDAFVDVSGSQPSVA